MRGYTHDGGLEASLHTEGRTDGGGCGVHINGRYTQESLYTY